MESFYIHYSYQENTCQCYTVKVKKTPMKNLLSFLSLICLLKNSIYQFLLVRAAAHYFTFYPSTSESLLSCFIIVLVNENNVLYPAIVFISSV